MDIFPILEFLKDWQLIQIQNTAYTELAHNMPECVLFLSGDETVTDATERHTFSEENLEVVLRGPFNP